jgi:glycosyltransferase involved in cell wall biosynthesis
MKLLITTQTFWPCSDGVANATLQHALGFQRAGHEVVIATAFHPDRGRLPWDGLRVEQFRVGGNANCLFGFSGEVRRYSDFVSNADCDIVFFHCWQSWTTDIPMPNLDRLRPKRVLVSHGVSANTITNWSRSAVLWLGWRPYVWRQLPRAMKLLDCIVFLSGRIDRDRFYDRRVARALGIRRTAVIPNGVDLAAHDAALPDFRKQHQLDGRLLLLCVGKFSDLKNELGVVRAVLRADIDKATLILIGPEMNDYAGRLAAVWAGRRRARDVELRCLCNLTEAEILGAHRAADIYLSASRTECFPLVILDAMAAHTPFVSTPVGCVPDLPGGLLAATEREMAQGITRLAGTPALRAQLGNQGRAACEQLYNWPAVSRQYAKLICDLEREDGAQWRQTTTSDGPPQEKVTKKERPPR